MLLSAKSAPFDSPDYTFEFKFDGVRMLAYTFGGARLYNRKTAPRTNNYPEIINELQKLPQDLVLDGEVIAVGEGGRQDFYSLLRRDFAAGYKPVAGIEICYAVFDILFESAKDITKLPLF